MRLPPDRRFALLWLALALIVVVRAMSRPEQRGVLLDHLEFGRRLLAGEDVHGPWRSGRDAPERPLHAPYPPSFGLLVAPFSVAADLLGLRAVRGLWALLQLGAIFVLARWLARAPSAPRGPPDPAVHRWLLLGTLLLGSRFVLRDMHGGGGNLINLALCVLSFDAQGRGHHARSGLWLGLSLATKPTQLWLLPVYVALGLRRATGFAVLTGAGAVLLSLLLLRGDTGPWLRWLQGSLLFAAQQDVFAAPSAGFPEFEWMNQSLRCGLGRWLGTVPPEIAARVSLAPPGGLGLEPATVAWIARLGSLLLLAAVLAVAARRRGDPHSRMLVFAAALLLSLLLSPLSWKAHHVALLPLLYVLLRCSVEARSRPAIALLAVFVPAGAIGGELLGDELAELLNSLYVLTAFDVVLLLVVLRSTWRRSR